MQQEYLTNTPLDEALSIYLTRLVTAGVKLAAEAVSIRSAAGRTTAEAVYARRSVPHYLACAMDGIAVHADATFGASETAPIDLPAESYCAVDTGDSLPEGMDAVIMIEDLIHIGDKVRLIAPAVPWQNIRQIGEDFCAGDMLACSGTILTPALLGAMLAGGISTVLVYRRPHVVLIPTGDEIVPASAEQLPGLIPEFNSTVYGSFLENDGATVSVSSIIPDDPIQLQAALADAVEHADLVLLLAGSSAGRGDYSTDTIRALGEVVLHGLSIRPGKPAVLGICRHKPVIGLPGYPVSGLIVLEEVIRPILRQIYRLNIPKRPEVTARLTRRLVSSLKYQEYIRVRLSFIHGLLIAAPLDRGAGILTSYARADGLLVIPRDSEGIESGSVVTVRLLRPLSEIEQSLSVMGSHDPLLDEIAELLFQEGDPKVFLSSVHVGSMGGIMAIRRQEAHIAGIHLLDETNGEYNLSYVNRYFPDGGIILVEGVRRQQGLLVQSGNPLQIKNLDDIAKRGLRYVNRQKGAGTRLLLDHLLSQHQIAPDQLSGYSREEYTHTGVAAQIAAGSADAGLGILAAARICQLDFIPVTEECYDFLIDAASWNLSIVQRFIRTLRSDGFRQRLAQLGGYHVENPGQIRWPSSNASETENK